jgi:thiamine-phosphate pyrophosphorylase
VPAPQNCRLYLISPERLEHPAIFADDLRAALDGGDVAAFQLRLKGVDDTAIARAADTLRPVCQQRGVAFIMNDRPDLAVKLDCDGVHVGQDDMPYAEARRIVGPDVAFGAFFPSNRKTVTTPASLEIIEWWSELFEIPCVAIVGITVENRCGLLRRLRVGVLHVLIHPGVRHPGLPQGRRACRPVPGHRATCSEAEFQSLKVMISERLAGVLTDGGGDHRSVRDA